MKEEYLKQAKINDKTVADVRLFSLGKELKDDFFMYSYDITDDVVM